MSTLAKVFGALMPDPAARNKAMAQQARIYSGAASAKKNRAQAEQIRQGTSELAKLFSQYPIQGKLRPEREGFDYLPGQEREPLPKMSQEDKILALALRAPKTFGSNYESIYKGRGTDLKNKAYQNVQDMISGLDLSPEVIASYLSQASNPGTPLINEQKLINEKVKTEGFKGQEILSQTKQDQLDSISGRNIRKDESNADIENTQGKTRNELRLNDQSILNLKGKLEQEGSLNEAKIGNTLGKTENELNESKANVENTKGNTRNEKLLNAEKVKNEIRRRLGIDAGTQLKLSEVELVDVNKGIKILDKELAEKLNPIKIKMANLKLKAEGEKDEYKRKQYEENLKILKQQEYNLIQDNKNKIQENLNKVLRGKQTRAVTQSIKQGKGKGSNTTAKAKQFEESKNKTLATGKELLRMIDNDSSLVGGRGVYRKFSEDVRSIITGKTSSGRDKDGNPISGPATEFAAKLNLFKFKLVKPLMGESRLSNEERARVDSLLGNSLFTSPEQLRANIEEALTIVGGAETSVGGNQGTPLPAEYVFGNVRIPLNIPTNVSNADINKFRPDTTYTTDDGTNMIVTKSGEHVVEGAESEQPEGEVGDSSPKEGDEKIINGEVFIYHNGDWIREGID